MARNVKIDVYRMFFCIMIVVYHANKFFGEGVYFAKAWYIGVDFFFLLSGCFLMQSIERDTNCGQKEEAQTIFIKKFKNIYPLYIISYFVSFIIVQVVNHTSIREVIELLSRSVGKIFCLEMSGIDIRGGFALRGGWYVSAVLLATLVILGLYYIGKNYFYYITAPLGVILFLGYFNQKFKMIHQTSDWLKITYSGVVRAVAVMLLGCLCYKMGKCLAEKVFSKKKLLLINVIEKVAVCIVIIGSYFKAKSNFDFMYLILCAIGITIAYGVKSADNIISRKIAWLGKTLSYLIYLNYLWLIVIIKDLNLTINKKIILFVVSLVVVCGLVIAIEKILKFVFKKYMSMREKYVIVVTEG